MPRLRPAPAPPLLVSLFNAPDVFPSCCDLLLNVTALPAAFTALPIALDISAIFSTPLVIKPGRTLLRALKVALIPFPILPQIFGLKFFNLVRPSLKNLDTLGPSSLNVSFRPLNPKNVR